ncbi:MAG: hypothetical protein ABI300_08715 [Rhodanobacter sp.]
MEEQDLPRVDIRHPVPNRYRVGLLALGFGVAGAPLAWNIELLVGTALSGHQCYPRYMPLALPTWSGTWWFLLGLSVAAVVLGGCAGLVSWRSWRRTQDEHPSPAHSGEGRNRFLALCGMLTSGLFLVALLFSLAVVLMVPVCSG